MEVIVLEVFVSLVLVTFSVLLFVLSYQRRDLDQGDYLALRPLAEDDAHE